VDAFIFSKPKLPLIGAPPRAASQPHGVILMDGQEVADTLQCPHCQCHFVKIAGPAPFCTNCGAYECGKERCRTCIPFLLRLELFERHMIDEL